MKNSLNSNHFLTILWESILSATSKLSEPKVWQKKDRKGNIYWRVYNPTTGYCGSFNSEEEVRMWLEERYYLQEL